MVAQCLPRTGKRGAVRLQCLLVLQHLSLGGGVDTPMNIIKGGGGGKCAQILQPRGHCVTLTAIIR